MVHCGGDNMGHFEWMVWANKSSSLWYYNPGIVRSAGTLQTGSLSISEMTHLTLQTLVNTQEQHVSMDLMSRWPEVECPEIMGDKTKKTSWSSTINCFQMIKGWKLLQLYILHFICAFKVICVRDSTSMPVWSGTIRHRAKGAVSQRRCWEMD